MAKITKNSLQLTKDKQELKKVIRGKDIEYKQLEERYDAMTRERDELQAKLNKLDRGFNWYIINDERLILSAGQVLGGFVTSYLHPLPKDVDKQYYRLENGNEVLDNGLKKKYRGGL